MKSPRKEPFRRIIVSKIANVSQIPIEELPFEGKKIQRIWTILDENLLRSGIKEETHPYYQAKLDEIPLRHGVNVFLEDPLHDWQIRNGVFCYYSRIVEKGQQVDLLVEYTNLDTENGEK